MAFARQVTALRDAGCECLTDLDAGLADAHRICRSLMLDLGLIPGDRLLIVPLDDEGIDSEIANLCRSIEPAWTLG